MRLAAPAAHAAIVLAFDGDEIDRAVKAHPAGSRWSGHFDCPGPALRHGLRLRYPASQQSCGAVIASGKESAMSTRSGTVSRSPSTSAGFSRSWWSTAPSAACLLACLLGGLVGLEREVKRKSAGVRTNLLICMGAAFFTLSPLCWPATAARTRARSPRTSCRASAFSARDSSFTIAAASADSPAPPASGWSHRSAWPAARDCLRRRGRRHGDRDCRARTGRLS